MSSTDHPEYLPQKGFGGEFLVLRGSRHSLIATPEAISIGCMRNTPDWWREHYAGVGRSEGYSAAEIEEYRQHIEYAAAWLAARKPKTEMVEATA